VQQVGVKFCLCNQLHGKCIALNAYVVSTVGTGQK